MHEGSDGEGRGVTARCRDTYKEREEWEKETESRLRHTEESSTPTTQIGGTVHFLSAI